MSFMYSRFTSIQVTVLMLHTEEHCNRVILRTKKAKSSSTLLDRWNPKQSDLVQNIIFFLYENIDGNKKIHCTHYIKHS